MSITLIHSKQGNGQKEIGRHIGAESNEFTILCPKCCAFETVCFIDDMLVPTKKFSQADSRIYHDCGSNEPCRFISHLLSGHTNALQPCSLRELTQVGGNRERKSFQFIVDNL